ncbi:MAG: outer membrane protein assembly factor BamD [Sandaracinaceae bacterium]|nr:outer membrane protein assembly factor BamD [Sandaracinaceae bacterium]
MSRFACLFALAFCAAQIVGCGGARVRQNLSYGDSAREAYETAMEDFRDENCEEAQPLFRKVRRNYSYSRFAALAELRLADCLLLQKKYVEAISAYRTFTRYRPSHSDVPYARFKMAEAYFAQVPEDFFLAPPAEERDQSQTRDALRQLRQFILDFPDDPHVGDANRMAHDALTLLARHELYVAQFYLDRDHPGAAVGRLQTLLHAYRGSGVEEEALLLLGRTYLHLADPPHAREAFDELIRRFPESGYAESAREYLAEMGANG